MWLQSQSKQPHGTESHVWLGLEDSGAHQVSHCPHPNYFIVVLCEHRLQARTSTGAMDGNPTAA